MLKFLRLAFGRASTPHDHLQDAMKGGQDRAMAALARAKGGGGMPAIPSVDPKTHTLVDLDISN